LKRKMDGEAPEEIKRKKTILSQFYSSVRLNFKWWRLWRRY